MQNFPKQRLSYSQKAANNFKWAKETVDALLSYSPLSTASGTKNSAEYERKLSNYRLYNNIIDQDDLVRQCNPLGLDVGQLKEFVQPYNKTYNKIQVLLGDELARPFNFKALLVDTDGIRSKMEKKDSMVRNYIYQQLQQSLQQIQSDYVPELVEQMSEEILPPEEIKKYMKYTYRDRREILSEKILEYLTKRLSIPELKSDGYKHGLISGEEIVYVGSNRSNPYLEIINPLGFFFHKSPETKWIQDGLYAGFRTYMTVGEVLDRYAPFLTAEQIKKLEDNNTSLAPIREVKMGPAMEYNRKEEDSIFNSILGIEEGSYGPTRQVNILVQHVEWRSQRKVGFLTFVNQYGDEESTVVSEDFITPPEAETETISGPYNSKITYKVWEEDGSAYKLNWDFIPEIWSATKLGMDTYCMIGPKEDQFRSKDNPYEVQLGYHGLVYNAMNAESVSLMDRMKPFQYLYFIVMHKLKKAIAQDQGKIFHFDVSMVDPTLGLEKTLYYLKELNIDFYNPLMNADQAGQFQRGKVSHTSDMSNMQNIVNYISVLAALDNQISEVAGVTKGREGQVSPSEAVTNAQANLQMSALVTELYFQAHFKLWEKVLTSLVAVARNAWKDKDIVKQYILDDLSTSTLEMSANEPQDWEIGVFISNSGRENEMFQALKGIADGLLNTNRATFSDLIKLYEATSSAELRAAIETSEEKAIQTQQQSAQAEMQAKAELEKSRQEFELEKQAREFEHEVLIAQIESFKFQKDQDADNDGIPDQFEVEKFLTEASLKSRALDLQERKMKIDDENKKKDLALKARTPRSNK